MSQAYYTIAGTGNLGSRFDQVGSSLSALRSCFSGATEPTDTTPGMLWFDTASERLFVRNNADAAWVDVAEQVTEVYRGNLAGSFNAYVAIPLGTHVKSLTVISDTSTSGSDGSNYYQFDLVNITDGLSLFATPPTTNGDELAADSRWDQDCDQNQDLVSGKVLEMQVTEVGSPTNLASAEVLIFVTASQLLT